ELGVGAGDRVALLLQNSIEYLEAGIATVPVGATPVPLNWHWRGEEIGYVLGDSAAKALILHGDLWPSIAAAVPPEMQLIAVPRDGEGRSPDLPERALWWPDWVAEHEPWVQELEATPMSVMYTSGTTGRPKGVVRDAVTEEQRETN